MVGALHAGRLGYVLTDVTVLSDRLTVVGPLPRACIPTAGPPSTGSSSSCRRFILHLATIQLCSLQRMGRTRHVLCGMAGRTWYFCCTRIVAWRATRSDNTAFAWLWRTCCALFIAATETVLCDVAWALLTLYTYFLSSSGVINAFCLSLPTFRRFPYSSPLPLYLPIAATCCSPAFTFLCLTTCSLYLCCQQILEHRPPHNAACYYVHSITTPRACLAHVSCKTEDLGRLVQFRDLTAWRMDERTWRKHL